MAQRWGVYNDGKIGEDPKIADATWEVVRQRDALKNEIMSRGTRSPPTPAERKRLLDYNDKIRESDARFHLKLREEAAMMDKAKATQMAITPEQEARLLQLKTRVRSWFNRAMRGKDEAFVRKYAQEMVKEDHTRLADAASDTSYSHLLEDINRSDPTLGTRLLKMTIENPRFPWKKYLTGLSLAMSLATVGTNWNILANSATEIVFPLAQIAHRWGAKKFISVFGNMLDEASMKSWLSSGKPDDIGAALSKWFKNFWTSKKDEGWTAYDIEQARIDSQFARYAPGFLPSVSLFMKGAKLTYLIGTKNLYSGAATILLTDIMDSKAFGPWVNQFVAQTLPGSPLNRLKSKVEQLLIPPMLTEEEKVASYENTRRRFIQHEARKLDERTRHNAKAIEDELRLRAEHNEIERMGRTGLASGEMGPLDEMPTMFRAEANDPVQLTSNEIKTLDKKIDRSTRKRARETLEGRVIPLPSHGLPMESWSDGPYEPQGWVELIKSKFQTEEPVTAEELEQLGQIPGWLSDVPDHGRLDTSGTPYTTLGGHTINGFHTTDMPIYNKPWGLDYLGGGSDPKPLVKRIKTSRRKKGSGLFDTLKAGANAFKSASDSYKAGMTSLAKAVQDPDKAFYSAITDGDNQSTALKAASLLGQFTSRVLDKYS